MDKLLIFVTYLSLIIVGPIHMKWTLAGRLQEISGSLLMIGISISIETMSKYFREVDGRVSRGRGGFVLLWFALMDAK